MEKYRSKMASRIHASYVSIIQRICDVFAIYTAIYIVSYIKQFSFNNQSLLAFLTIVTVFQLIGELSDFYRSWRGEKLVNELILCVKNVTITVLISYIIIWSFSGVGIEGLITYYLLLVLLIVTFRVVIRLLYTLYFKFFKKAHLVLVIGQSEKAKKLYNDLVKSKWIGHAPIGLFSWSENRDDTDGNYDDMIELVKQGKVRKVYLVIDQNNLNRAKELVEVLADSTCSTIIVPEIFSYNLLYSRVEDIDGVPIIPLYDTRMNDMNALLKRIEDICFSSIILILISPILLAIAIAIKLTSPGPVFFKQIRYGLNGEPIKVFKFRSMKVMENGAKVTQAVKNDPRVTTVGRFIRRTSLDELPQFFNVFIGNMSVVGPRPHAVAHNEEYRKLINGYMLRHKVKPGITGLAQIRGWRGETDTLDKMEKRIECDLQYIRNWSIGLDINIIFLTIFHGFINKAAY